MSGQINEHELTLHRRLSESQVKCVEKANTLNAFYLGILNSGISDFESAIEEEARLQGEERQAREERESALRDYMDYMKTRKGAKG